MKQFDFWAWFKQPLKQEPRNDHERELRDIVQLYYDGGQYRQSEPEQTLAIFEQARWRAEQINEPCYAVFFGYLVCDVLLYNIRDTIRALDYAIKLISVTCKPKYLNCIVMGDIYSAVTTAYLIIDPIGYAGEIEKSLSFLENEIPLTYESQCTLLSKRSALSYALDQLDEAIALGLKYLEVSEGMHFRQFHAYLMLCEYAYDIDDVDLAFAYVSNAETHLNSQKNPQARAIIDIFAWKAVLEFRRGNESEAHRYFRQASARLQDFGRDPWQMYCTHIAEYLELQGKIDHAIKLYERTAVTVLGTGKHWSICNYWLERCRFMGRAGLPYGVELKSAYDAAEKLLKPELYLAKLMRVEAGDYSSRKI